MLEKEKYTLSSNSSTPVGLLLHTLETFGEATTIDGDRENRYKALDARAEAMAAHPSNGAK